MAERAPGPIRITGMRHGYHLVDDVSPRRPIAGGKSRCLAAALAAALKHPDHYCVNVDPLATSGVWVPHSWGDLNMAVDIQAIVGEHNMTIEAKERVIALLAAQPTNATTKRFLYARWARLVGYHPSKDDLDRVAPWAS